MTPNVDPWRTLGLAQGATQDEIRRAYRRLAKINHPDAAGEAALPRFLAIQAAYEQLAGPGRERRVGGRPGSGAAGSRGAPPAAGPREPWRADPDRARASGRADGRRAPGARPTGTTGTTSGGPGTANGTTGTSGTRPTNGTRASSGANASSGKGRRGTSTRRAANKAGPGSTSYEGADQEPFEPGWSGATWYGASSGTYWTINPKEYADPRKHGPEYQARARRARGEEPLQDDEAPDRDEPVEPRPAPETTTAPQTESTSARPSREAHGGPGAAAGPGPLGPEAVGAAWAARRSPGGRRSADGAASGHAASMRATWDERPQTPNEERATGDDPVARVRRRLGNPSSWFEQPADERGFRGPLLRHPTTPLGRLAIVLLGWPPIGLLAATVINESTGCGRYAAGCPSLLTPGIWLLQAAILLVLLAIPAAAAWSAHGTIAVAVAGIPLAIMLSAAGGSNVRETSAPLLLAALAVAYLVGVAYAIFARRRFGAG